MARYVDMDACPCNECATVADCVPMYLGCQNYKKWYEGVDAVPVVHGHWEMNNGKLICSKCKIPSAMSRQFVGAQYKSRYCPNCGAKMDEQD